MLILFVVDLQNSLVPLLMRCLWEKMSLKDLEVPVDCVQVPLPIVTYQIGYVREWQTLASL